MEKNAAGGFGGAIYILETSYNGILELMNVTFSDNVALKGGAMYSQSGTHIKINQNCKFSDNKAVSGGAIHISVINSYKDIITLDFISFMNNSVKTTYKDLTFPNEVQDYLNNNVLIISETETQDSNILLSKFSDDPCYPGGGGAVCLQIYDTQDAAKLDVQLSNLTFINNSGYVGGAALLVTKNENIYFCKRDKCRSYINIFNSEFYGNVASGAGGAIFTYSPEYIQDSITGYSLVEKDKTSLKFENNSVIDGGYGKDIASGTAKLNLTDFKLELLNNINSNDDEIEIKLGIYDFYGQQIIKAVQHAGNY